MSRRLYAWICILVLTCWGCQSFQTSHRLPPKDISLAAPATAVGKIVGVQQAQNFVVIQFETGKIPAPRTELGVFRGAKKIGRVQMTESSDPPFGVANILEGLINVNDTVGGGDVH